MTKTTICKETAATGDGLLVATVEADGVWAAFEALRSGVREAAAGRCVRATFVTALDRDGQVVRSRDHTAHLLLLGYRIHGSRAGGPRSFRPRHG